MEALTFACGVPVWNAREVGGQIATGHELPWTLGSPRTEPPAGGQQVELVIGWLPEHICGGVHSVSSDVPWIGAKTIGPFVTISSAGRVEI